MRIIISQHESLVRRTKAAIENLGVLLIFIIACSAFRLAFGRIEQLKVNKKEWVACVTVLVNTLL